MEGLEENHVERIICFRDTGLDLLTKSYNKYLLSILNLR